MTLSDMKAKNRVLTLIAIFVASSVGVLAQGGATAARLVAPAPTGSMGAMTKAASQIRSSRAAALAGKGLTSGSGATVGKSTQIMGYLWTSNNGAMPDVSVQIRNTVTDVIEGKVVTNSAGEFLFQNVAPGEYVIEYVSDTTSKVLATGHPFTVAPGETVATFVRLSNGLPMLLPNELSNLTSNAAAQAVTSAATRGVTSVATPLVSLVPPVVPTGGGARATPPPVVSAIK